MLLLHAEMRAPKGAVWFVSGSRYVGPMLHRDSKAPSTSEHFGSLGIHAPRCGRGLNAPC